VNAAASAAFAWTDAATFLAIRLNLTACVPGQSFVDLQGCAFRLQQQCPDMRGEQVGPETAVEQ
jgi:hypothetical protein